MIFFFLSRARRHNNSETSERHRRFELMYLGGISPGEQQYNMLSTVVYVYDFLSCTIYFNKTFISQIIF